MDERVLRWRALVLVFQVLQVQVVQVLQALARARFMEQLSLE